MSELKLTLRVNPNFPCPVVTSERESGNPQCINYTDAQCGCDHNELRVLVPHGYPCHRIDKKGGVHCITREIPGLVEAINNSQYFRWSEKVVGDEVKLWIELYYKSKNIKPNLKLQPSPNVLLL